MGTWLLMLACGGDPTACNTVLGSSQEIRLGSELRCMAEGDSIVRFAARTNIRDKVVYYLFMPSLHRRGRFKSRQEGELRLAKNTECRLARMREMRAQGLGPTASPRRSASAGRASVGCCSLAVAPNRFEDFWRE
jgi:hypothetical protein